MKAWIGDGCIGRLVDADEARISIMDHGFTVGDGVFETLKVTQAGPFALTRHLNRLSASAGIVGLAAPDPGHVREAALQVVAANADEIGPLARLRITWTSGAAPLGSDRVEADPTLVIATMRQSPWPATTSAITIPWVRNPRSLIAGAKSTSYAENVVALVRAHEAGASEAVLGTTDGLLCEGTGTNVFVLLDGRLITPTLDTGCLDGITRGLVIEWLGATQEDLPLEGLADVEAAFLTSSTRDVHPLERIDGRRWPAPHPLVAQLAAEFLAQESADVDP